MNPTTPPLQAAKHHPPESWDPECPPDPPQTCRLPEPTRPDILLPSEAAENRRTPWVTQEHPLRKDGCPPEERAETEPDRSDLRLQDKTGLPPGLTTVRYRKAPTDISDHRKRRTEVQGGKWSPETDHRPPDESRSRPKDPTVDEDGEGPGHDTPNQSDRHENDPSFRSPECLRESKPLRVQEDHPGRRGPGPRTQRNPLKRHLNDERPLRSLRLLNR